MQTTQHPGAPVERQYENVKEKLMRLFTAGGEAVSAEREVDDRVSRVASDFLRMRDTSSDVRVKSLTEMFKDSKIPDYPGEIDAYIDYLADNVVAHSTRTSSPLFIGHMTSGLPYFVRPLGKLLTAMNQNTVKMETAKALTPFERQALAMIHRLIFNFSDEFYEHHIQRKESTLGLLVSGGTLANVTALWCIRNFHLGPRDKFAGIVAEGLPATLERYGYKGAVIIGSRLMHYSFEKAADLLGIGAHGLIKVPTDKDNRIELATLREAIEECRSQKRHIIAIVGVAGGTDTGAIDPLPEMADLAQEYQIPFHVDAAWGGAVLFSERYRYKLAGIDRADSVTIDGHKQMYLPMGIGLVMFRNPRIAKSIEKQARYIVRAGSADLGRRSLEGSRPATALYLHAALHIMGVKGYEFLIDEGIRKTQFMAEVIRMRPEFELMAEPQINILVYRYIPEQFRRLATTGRLSENDEKIVDQINERLQKAQRQAGRSFVSRTTIDTIVSGRRMPSVVLRAVIANPLTTEQDIIRVLNEQVNIASNCSDEQ
jgi:glutamate decarboxylase